MAKQKKNVVRIHVVVEEEMFDWCSAAAAKLGLSVPAYLRMLAYQQRNEEGLANEMV